uniref:Uncharacterized protein n=1 Tax=Aegilops tauschii subsp. strangulata TaxID=200361 RepID=A0A453NBV7_AEGTS
VLYFEATILNEKHIMEKRIAYMRMAFDQQQQDLVDVASKSLAYRQDIIPTCQEGQCQRVIFIQRSVLSKARKCSERSVRYYPGPCTRP